MEKRTPAEVLRLVQDEGIEIVDVRFVDLPGLMQHFSVPAHALTEDVFEEGFGFDGSSIRGFQEIQESDMLLMPDPNTAVIDPFREHRTLNVNCFVRDPVTLEPYSRDPRYVATKAEAYLGTTGLADTCYFGPEAEFFIFDDVRYSQDQRHAFYQVDSVEGHWNSGADEGPEPRLQDPSQGGLLPGPPGGPLPGPAVGDDPHHGASRHRDRGAAPRGGDRGPGRDRHAVRHAARHGRQAHALQVRGEERGPRPRGSPPPSCPSRCSRTTGRACTATSRCGRTATPSSTGRATGGCRTPGGGTSAACSSTPGRCWPSRHRPPTPTSGSCRATRRRSTWCTRSATARRRAASPCTRRARRPSGWSSAAPTPRATRTSLSRPCSWRASTACRTASSRPTRWTRTSTTCLPRSCRRCPRCPGSLDEALAALEADHDFLKAGGVFTDDLLETWIDYKRLNEVDAIRLRPHPWEFMLYYDI